MSTPVSRRNKFLIFLPALLLLLLTILMAWLLRTESGAGFVWQQISRLIEGNMQAQSLSGDLSATLLVQGFEFNNDSARVLSPAISLSLKFDIFPPAIHVSQLHSEDLRIQLLENPNKDEERSLADIVASLKLPLPLRLESVNLESLQILDVEGAELFLARNISLQADWHRTLDIEHFKAHSLNTDWNARAKLQLGSPFSLEGKVNAASLVPVADGQSLPVDWLAEFSGNLSSLKTQVQLDQPGVYMEGRLLDLLTTPAWNLQLQSAQLDWPLAANQGLADAAQPEISLRDILLSSQGTWANYDLQLAAQLSGEQIPEVTIDLIGNGERKNADFEHLRLSGPEVSFIGRGQLGSGNLDSGNFATEDHDGQELFGFSTQGRIEYLHPERWLADWPQAHPLTGELSLSVSEAQVEVTNVALEITGRDTRVQGEGLYQFNDGRMTAEVAWQSLSWPLNADDGAAAGSGIFSRSGQLTLAGQADDWSAQGDLLLQAANLPEGRMQLNATGNQQAAALVIDKGNVLGGEFAGTVDYQWAEPAGWSVQLTANQISTTALLPDFPGVLSGTVWAQGAMDSTLLQFDLRDVNGQIRGRPIAASGKFSLRDWAIEADNLQLHSGSAHLQLDGGMGPEQQLRFSARVDELSELWPEASGRLQARGKLSLDARSPLLDINLTADELHWGENQIASIRTENGPDGSQIFRISQATLAGRELTDVKLTLAGQTALEYLQLQGQLDKTSIEASLRGSLLADGQGRISGWAGDIESLRLDQPGLGSLNLENPAALQWTATQSRLGTTCLRGTKNGLICLQGEWSEQGKSTLRTELQQVSLDNVRLFVDSNWGFTHVLDGSLEWQKDAQQAASALARFTLSPGELLFENESTQFSTGAGLLEFQISEGNLHSGRLTLPIPGSGDIIADFSVDRWLDGAAAGLQAGLRLNLMDLTPLQLLVPYLDVIEGELTADVSVTGSLEKPQFTGHATLVRGRIEEHSFGLVLEDILLAGAVYQYDHTEFNGSFRAGTGRGQIKADLRFEDFLNPQLRLQISGENLLLVDVPDLTLLAEPDLDLSWSPGLLQLNGRILVPRAQLSPRYLPTSSAIESPDLIIVSDQGDVLAAPVAEATGPLKITGRVEVELGDEVSLTLDRATVNFRGKTNFIWDDALLPMGDGAFWVSGEISAYGQLLNISDGRVSFPRIPADNPHLNIRAEREIFGNSQIKRAGVRVSGTLQRPVLEPYTDPMTTRERALAMLLTGSDFDYEQGVGAVEVGMYIAPKLYVSYGIGLFEDQNVISARYDLGKGFGVKATSGQRETGVDISYTIEK